MEVTIPFFYRNSFLEDRTIEINKTYLCDMANANACQKRAPFINLKRIGPRYYAVYKCPEHGKIARRINELTPTEINIIRLKQIKT